MRIVSLQRSSLIPSARKKIVHVRTKTLNGARFQRSFQRVLHIYTSISATSDYNFVPDGDDCILAGPEAIPPGQCLKDGDRFMGSSGFRKIPGNTCDASRGIEKDHPKEKDCSAGQATPGTISHQRVSGTW